MQPTNACAVQGTASSFHMYLETLPQEHDCVLCWSKGQLSELQGMFTMYACEHVTLLML